MSEREARSTRSCLLQLNSLPLLTVTLYPLSASRIAVAAPMPAPPPVTRALGIFWAEFENAAEVFLLFGLLAFFSENNAKLFTLFSFPFSLSFSPPPLSLGEDVVRRPRRGPRPPPGRRARRTGAAKQPRGLPDRRPLVRALAAADRRRGHGGRPRRRPRQARHAQAGLFSLREQARPDAGLCRGDAEGSV